MVIWPLPRITFQELSLVEETRPVALLTSAEAWPVVSDHLALPVLILSLIHISEPTRLLSISYAVVCLKNKNTRIAELAGTKSIQ